MFERLTIRTVDNDICYEVKKDIYGAYDILDLAKCIDDGDGEEANILLDISNRLAAYEDSGLSPEEVQELAKAKAEGRLKILPAKPGDIIYRPEALQFCWVITRVEIYEDEIVFIDDSDNIFRPDSIGKTVFLTHEEAVKVIGGGQDAE